MIQEYEITELAPLIAWPYFNYAWGVQSASKEEKAKIRHDAETLLAKWQGKVHTRSIVKWFSANSEGDDILIDGTRFPMLRQQNDRFLSLSDFIRPVGLGDDKIGLFATTTDDHMPELNSDDPYERMLAQTVADRLAEATSEMIGKEHPGIRPAAGYPVMPDLSINFLIDEKLQFKRIGITLTESGMMMPHASVSGLIFAHPKATYFNIGEIGSDQLRDYAYRRGYSLEQMRKFIKNVQDNK